MIYAFGVELEQPFEQGLAAVLEAVKGAGLGIVSDVDVQAIMRAKLQEEIPAYRILGACAPSLAKRVMEAIPEAGSLLPCNIVVRELGAHRTGVTFMDPEAVFGLAEDAVISEIGREARALVEAVRDRLSGQHPLDLTH